LSYIQQLAQDDFIWDAIIEHLPARKRASTFDFNICCPMCVRLGEPRPDRAYRCGLIKNGDGFAISCFNCPLRVRWTYGSSMSNRLKEFMSELGIPELQIKRMAHRAYSIRRTVESSPEAAEIIGSSFLPQFTNKDLPSGARTIKAWADDGCNDPMFLRAVEYLYSRGDTVAEAIDYYWTPFSNKTAEGGSDRMNERIIIPFRYRDSIVGYSARMSLDQSKSKYWSKVPPDYLFNNHVLDLRDRKYVFIVEGPFDALAIDGLSTLGAKMTDKQMAWINFSGRTPILIGDRDRTGMLNIDNALRNDWGVAFPRLASSGWWDAKTKDCATAVEKYGRLYVTRSIIETTTFDKRKIEVYRKMAI